MPLARARPSRPLATLAALALALVPGAAPGVTPEALPGHACARGWCALGRPTEAELDAIVADAERLLATYEDDSTPLGRQCRALGATMQARAGDVRMLAYMWRAVDPEGNLAAVTGDAHRVEAVPGTGLVHIARGFDPLNPDRGLPAIVRTARHEFAHLNGASQEERWGADAAERLAGECAAP